MGTAHIFCRQELWDSASQRILPMTGTGCRFLLSLLDVAHRFLLKSCQCNTLRARFYKTNEQTEKFSLSRQKFIVEIFKLLNYEKFDSCAVVHFTFSFDKKRMKSSTSSLSGALRTGLASQQHLGSLAAGSRETWNPQKSQVDSNLSTSSASVGSDNRLLHEAWDDAVEFHEIVEDFSGDSETKVKTEKEFTDAIDNSIAKLRKRWAINQVELRPRVTCNYTGESYVEFSLRNVKPIDRNHLLGDSAYGNFTLEGDSKVELLAQYVAEILDLEKRHNTCRVRLPLHEVGELSSELVDSLCLVGYQFTLAEQEMAAARINSHLLKELSQQRLKLLHQKPSDYDHSRSLAILGTKIDCSHFWQDLDEIVLGGPHLPGDAVSAVDFPAVPFLLNHLRNWGNKERNCSAIQWFFARQWSIDIQPFSASILPEFATADDNSRATINIVKELLEWVSRLDQSKVSEERQVGKDLRFFVNFHAPLASRILHQPTLRSHL